MTNNSIKLRVGDELLTFREGERRSVPSDFTDENNVLLMHGFTASSSYMQKIATDLHDLKLNVFVFEYNSYKGIDCAANSLFQILSDLDRLGNGIINKNKINIIAHSMGGLVAKTFCVLYKGSNFVSCIFTIGTPHNGTLADADYINTLVKYYETLGGAGAPKGYSKNCRSLLQIMKIDDDQLLQYLDNDNSKLDGIRLGSISGGKRFIEISKTSVFNKIANNLLQKHLGHEDNDGLVGESSSDWSSNFSGTTQEPVRHLNTYPEYNDLNHSYLINNHSVSLQIASFVYAK